MAVAIPQDFEAVTIETLAARLDAVYDEEFRYGGMRTKKQRDAIARKTRSSYNAVFAITFGFTPVAWVGSEWARRNPRASKAVCDECGHVYALRSKGMMRRHAQTAHGRTYFRQISALLEEVRASRSAA